MVIRKKNLCCTSFVSKFVPKETKPNIPRIGGSQMRAKLLEALFTLAKPFMSCDAHTFLKSVQTTYKGSLLCSQKFP